MIFKKGKKVNEKLEKMENDILVLTLRLMGEDPDTFSPEVRDVLERWIPEAKRILKGEREI